MTQSADSIFRSNRQNNAVGLSPHSLRVGLLSWTDPGNPRPMAGMPFRMAQALHPHVGELLTFSPQGGTGLRRPPIQPRTWPIVGKMIRHFQWRCLTFDGSIRALEHYYPDYTRRRTLHIAEKTSRWLLSETANHSLDVLLGCIASWPLYCLADQPAVFFTDATTTMVNSTYPRFNDRCQGFKVASAEIENSVYSKVFAVAGPADAVIASAVVDHGLTESRGYVVPMGANITPAKPLSSTDHLSTPDKSQLRLTIIASDPIRKRLDFAVDVAECLAELGWQCRLTSVGPGTEKARGSRLVDHLGPLQWSVATDRPKLESALADCHFFILPSTGEGAAIAPAEAAHFGRPAIVSDVAGLPTVVLNGETGHVLPISATVQDYARTIADTASDRATYKAMSNAALHRAQRLFTWEAWGERIADLLAAAVEARR